MTSAVLRQTRSTHRIARLIVAAVLAFGAASAAVNTSATPASAACQGCVILSAPSINLNVTAQPGKQAVIDQHNGVALYTPLTTGTPGAGGTIWVVGHRTTHGAVFNKVPSLVPGDTIDVIDDNGAYQYIVNRVMVVDEAEWDSHVNINDMSRSTLILQTSHPERRLRYLVEAFASGITYKPSVAPSAPNPPAVAPAEPPTAPETTVAPAPAVQHPPASPKFGLKSIRSDG